MTPGSDEEKSSVDWCIGCGVDPDEAFRRLIKLRKVNQLEQMWSGDKALQFAVAIAADDSVVRKDRRSFRSSLNEQRNL